MYDYEVEKEKIFSEKGQKLFLAIRDQIKKKLAISGAITMGRAISLPEEIGAADGWHMMACVDRLVELGELQEVPTSGAAQYRIFISK